MRQTGGRKWIAAFKVRGKRETETEVKMKSNNPTGHTKRQLHLLLPNFAQQRTTSYRPTQPTHNLPTAICSKIVLRTLCRSGKAMYIVWLQLCWLPLKKKIEKKTGGKRVGERRVKRNTSCTNKMVSKSGCNIIAVVLEMVGWIVSLRCCYRSGY